MSKRADNGPLRRQRPPARFLQGNARKRGSTTYHLREGKSNQGEKARTPAAGQGREDGYSPF